MWIVVTLVQLVALMLLVIFALRWSGRWRRSLEGRRRGWPFYRMLIAWAPLQGLVLISIPIQVELPQDPNPLVSLGMLVLILGIYGLLFVAPVVFIVLGYVWAPRFLLPGWVKERLHHGDPVNTADPSPEVQPLLSHPRNQPLTETERLEKEVREKYHVDIGGWVIGAVATSVSALLLIPIALGIGPLGLEVGQQAPSGGTASARVMVTPDNIMRLRLRYGIIGLISLGLAIYFMPKVPQKIRQSRQNRVAEAQERAERGLPQR